MQAWRILLSHLLMTLLPIMIMDLGEAEAAQKAQKSTVKQESSPIVGELDESDTIPTDEGDDEMAADEGEVMPLTSKESSKAKTKNSKNNVKTGKEKIKDKKADQKRKELKEGFSQAEEFHKMWFNLPSTKIKSSLENLIKFCKVACTKKQCMDEEIANNCHLICPESTTKQCPDPLKQAGDEDMDAEEFMASDAPSNDLAAFIDDSDMQVPASPGVADSIDQVDSELMNGEGEGG